VISLFIAAGRLVFRGSTTLTCLSVVFKLKYNLRASKIQNFPGGQAPIPPNRILDFPPVLLQFQFAPHSLICFTAYAYTALDSAIGPINYTNQIIGNSTLLDCSTVAMCGS